MRRIALCGVAASAVLLAPGLLSAQRAGAVTIAPGQECPAGMTEVRPQTCQAPQLDPPSILDYRPRSTLVVPEHPVPKPKYPAIDFHGHPPGLDGSEEGLRRLGEEMDRIGLRTMIVASPSRWAGAPPERQATSSQKFMTRYPQAPRERSYESSIGSCRNSMSSGSANANCS